VHPALQDDGLADMVGADVAAHHGALHGESDRSLAFRRRRFVGGPQLPRAGARIVETERA
jgi:hypothetical protein